MFQAVSLTIVLALTVAPNAALLCHARCEPLPAATSPCEHAQLTVGSSTVQQDTCDECPTLVPGVVSFRTDDLRHSLTALPTDLLIVTRRYLPAGSTCDARFGGDPGRHQSLNNHPLPSVLRI